MAAFVYPMSTDPVVVYDILCEARNRLLGSYIALEADHEKVVSFALALDVRLDSISIDDLDEQRSLTKQFTAEREALLKRDDRPAQNS